MKIGVVLFGHVRSYRQTHSSFEELQKTLLQAGRVDVFCHTWDIEESVTASWWKEHKEGELPPAVTPVEIESKYRPVLYEIEPSRRFDDSSFKIKSSIPVAGILSMLHSQRRAFELLKQQEQKSNEQYDVVIKTRYDLLYEIAPSFPVLLSECVSGKSIFLPSSNSYELIGSNSDVFALGPHNEMEKYFTFCDNFSEAVSIYQERAYRQLVPELCMTVYLDSRQIQREDLTGLRIHILRKSGEKFQINSDKNFAGNNPHCFHRKVIEGNIEILPETSGVNADKLVKKYMSWLNGVADKNKLQEYSDYYRGSWPGISGIIELAKKGKGNPVFTAGVMKDFFEEALRNGKYSRWKKLLMAIILMLYSGYGIFFIRLWRNVTFNRK